MKFLGWLVIVLSMTGDRGSRRMTRATRSSIRSCPTRPSGAKR